MIAFISLLAAVGFAVGEEEMPRLIVDGDTLSLEEVEARWLPDSADFAFEPPADWAPNLARDATVACSDTSGPASNLARLVDGEPYTAWSSSPGVLDPTIRLHFVPPIRLNRIAVFNRFTAARGTGGGCNSARTVEFRVFVADESASPIRVDTFELTGPKPRCFSTVGGGQTCFFIPRTEPDVFEIPTTIAARIELVVTRTWFTELGIESWGPELNAALSEVMCFLAPETE